ncbi:MAG: carbohydrate ABC transporter permease [Oscillospiraceae bacterium]|nr:carbohydrate ABC transporter permease [Oscillospiraceae bacterium]MDD3260646.1 carbohydrate ABC transporter permease [Oscillospiraceae bacterium]
MSPAEKKAEQKAEHPGRGRKIVIRILEYAALIFAAFWALIPVVSCVITAFKTPDEYANTNVMTLPKSWLYFTNFQGAWEKANMGLSFVNSFLILAVVLVCCILISSMLAFVLNRFKFRGNGLIRNLFLFASLVPGIAMQVTVYQIMYKLGLINSLPGYMLLLMGTDVISIYIFLQFFENLSVSLDESAILDGCTYFGVFFKILLPLLKPAIVTVLILKGVSTYNEYYMANLYLQDKTVYPVVSTCLYTFSGPMGTQYNFICAGVLITVIPILIIFLIFQKQVYRGLAAGAVKG